MIRDMSGKQCPFNKKLDCKDCRLWRQGIKLIGVEKRKEEVGDCVFHLLCDNVEMEHVAVRSTQSIMDHVRQASLFGALAMLADSAQAKAELKRLIVRNVDGMERMLGISEKKKSDLEDVLDMIEEETKDATRKITD